MISDDLIGGLFLILLGCVPVGVHLRALRKEHEAKQKDHPNNSSKIQLTRQSISVFVTSGIFVIVGIAHILDFCLPLVGCPGR